jgi:hypothetical protein
MSETLTELEQRLDDGIVAKIAELLGLPPPKLLPRLPSEGDRDLIVRFLLRENENLLIEREHLRQVVLALAEATRFLKAGSHHDAALCLVADFHWEQDQHGGGMKINSFTLEESDGYRERYEGCLGNSLERKYFRELQRRPQLKRIVKERGEPYEELIRIFALKPTDETHT